VAWPSIFSLGLIFTTPTGKTVRVDNVSPLVLTAVAGSPPPTLGTFITPGSNDEELLQPVTTYGLNIPPAHVAGQKHVVGTAPTLAWTGQANRIAESNGVDWAFIVPWTGLDVSVGTAPVLLYTYTGNGWVSGTTTITNTVTNTIGLTDGVHGDITVAGGGATLTVNPALLTAAVTNVSNNFAGGMEWFDPLGFASLTGPSQYATFTKSAPLPRLPGDGRLWIDINVSGAAFDSAALELQISFDDGTTWELTTSNGTGIPGDGTFLPVGVHVMPLETVSNIHDYSWFENTPVPTPTGLKYRWQTQGFYDVTSSGPIALRLHSKGWMPAGTTVTIIGVHFK
jgi:Protein of unknown function (DUF2793)